MALSPELRDGRLVIEQGADDRLLWSIDWSDFLASVGDSALSDCSFQAADGIVVESAGVSGSRTQFWLSGGEPGKTYWVRCKVETASGYRTSRDVSVTIRLSLSEPAGVFPSVADALQRFYASLSSVSPLIRPESLPENVALQRLLAAASEIQGALGVPLCPTLILPDGDTTEPPAGMPVIKEPGYDAPADFFSPSRFGALRLRVRPVIEVESMRMILPGRASRIDVPPSWIRLDHKYGLIHLVPDGTLIAGAFGVLGGYAGLSGYQVPAAIRVRYRAGIDLNDPSYASVLDTIVQSATLRVLRGAVTPSSSSVSADGLSQSASVDIDRMVSDLEDQIATLRLKILGPMWGVL